MLKFKDIIEKPIVVHCSTPDKAEKFLKICEQQGLTWFWGDKPTSDLCWNKYKTQTGYSIGYYHRSDGKTDPTSYVWSGNIYELYNGSDILNYDDLEEAKLLIEED